MKKVAVIMGSDSDWPVVKGACAQLQEFGIPYEAHILSAHRTPAAAAEFARGARQNGFGVLICAAGMAAHLAGAFAGNSTLPVIGIPMKGGRPAGHRPDAQRHPRGHRGHQRGQERRRAGRPDSGGLRRRTGRQAGRGPGEDGPADRREGSQAPGGALIQIGDRSDEIGVAERAARAVQIVRLRRTPQLLSSIS